MFLGDCAVNWVVVGEGDERLALGGLHLNLVDGAELSEVVADFLLAQVANRPHVQFVRRNRRRRVARLVARNRALRLQNSPRNL